MGQMRCPEPSSWPFGMRFLFHKMDTFHIKRWTRVRKMNGILSDILSGMRVVKAFSKEKAETVRFDRSSRDLMSAEIRRRVPRRAGGSVPG